MTPTEPNETDRERQEREAQEQREREAQEQREREQREAEQRQGEEGSDGTTANTNADVSLGRHEDSEPEKATK